ncbi:MAG: hypothetical protein V7L04_28135 [Nostoc sp.]
MIGSGEWGVGENNQCPMPNAQCPMPIPIRVNADQMRSHLSKVEK